MKPKFFASADEFRGWLEKNHATERELILGFYKKAAGKSGITYKEAVDEALCFGWIDGVLRRIDDERYMQRYTPRRTGSIWSNINVARVEGLKKIGRMHSAGLAAFEARTASKTGVYSFESTTPAKFSASDLKAFRGNKNAWAFFSAQAPWYRRKVTWWVVSAKQPATRARRLAALITASAARTRI